MNTPIILHRSTIGLIAILAGGLLCAFGIFALGYWIKGQEYGGDFAPQLCTLMAVVVLFATLLWALVYSRHTMTLTDTGIIIKSWNGLFFSTETSCDYEEIEDLSVKRGGLAALGLGFGSLTIQTAGAERANLRFDYLDNPEYWRSWIDDKS